MRETLDFGWSRNRSDELLSVDQKIWRSTEGSIDGVEDLREAGRTMRTRRGHEERRATNLEESRTVQLNADPALVNEGRCSFT